MIAWEPLTLGTLFGRYFVSYRSLDDPLAKAVEDVLESRGQEVWRDRRNLHSGDHWREGIASAIAASGDIIVLLTPEAAGSPEVLNEIKLGLRLKKRLHVFVTFDLISDAALRPVYDIIHGVNLIRVALPADRSGPVVARFATSIVETVLAPSLRPHPLDLSDFDRVYSKRLVPAVLPGPVLARYRGYLGAPEDPTLLMNFGLILAAMGDAGSAAELLRKACRASASPLPPYMLALILMEGRRPTHLRPSILDEAVHRGLAPCL